MDPNAGKDAGSQHATSEGQILTQADRTLVPLLGSIERQTTLDE